MKKKNKDSQTEVPPPSEPPSLPVLRKPAPTPDWIPSTSSGLTVDAIIEQMALIGFDHSVDPKTRLASLDKLLKHKGGYIERIQHSTVDQTQLAIATQMFSQMSLEERKQWFLDHQEKLRQSQPAPTPPTQDDQIEIPTVNQNKSTLDELHDR